MKGGAGRVWRGGKILGDPTDQARHEETKRKAVICGKGGTVSFMDRSTLYSKELFDKAFEIAERDNILCQPKTVVAGGNDSGVIHKSRGGVKVLTVSIPCRYLHSPSCVIKYEDAKESLRLVKALAEDFAQC